MMVSITPNEVIVYQASVLLRRLHAKLNIKEDKPAELKLCYIALKNCILRRKNIIITTILGAFLQYKQI